MSNSYAAPLTRYLLIDTDAVAAGSDGSVVLGIVPEDCTVTAVTYTPTAAITGANTNSRTLTVVNKGGAGAGTTTVATLALTSGVNAAAFDEKSLTLSVTAADLDLTADNVLAFNSTHIGTGIADPGGLVKVTLVRR
jgi:outer membrane autotransporter protein